ncbi:MAG: efflux RND transporter periplasmic adaptor subunit [Xanthobacteraceae bacterium]
MRVSIIRPVHGLVALSLVFPWTAGYAHEGEDHTSSQPGPIATGVSPRAEAASENFELVAVARGGTLTVYLDRRSSNEPVTGATVSIETPAGSGHDLIFTVASDGSAEVLTATLQVPPAIGADTEGSTPSPTGGTFVSGWKDRIGRSDPALLGAAAGGFVLGALVMGLLARRKPIPAVALVAILVALAGTGAHAHEGDDHAAASRATAGARDLAKRLADGSLFVPKPTQRLLAVRTDIAASGVHRRTIELPGRIIPDPNASGYVQASAGGRLSAPLAGFPRLGTRVNKGDVLAYVTPPVQTVDVSDMRQRQGELDQQISIVERRIARFEPLAQKGVVSLVQLDEARLELQGLKDRRSALDRVRAEPEALAAPVAGVIAEINAVAGQMAQPSAVLFQIMEPTRLWVEALSFDTLTGDQSAIAKTSTGRILPLGYQGAGFADRNQAVPVHFRIEGDVSGLRAGQFVTVLSATQEEKRGIAVPRASVVRSQNGQDLVFEHSSAERFEPRSVRLEPLDGDRVLVVSGLNEGVRIVTQGAELLDQVR